MVRIAAFLTATLITLAPLGAEAAKERNQRLLTSAKAQADRDHRSQRAAHGRRIDVGEEPADHPDLDEPPDTAMTGRGRDPHFGGQRTVRHPGVGLEQAQQPPIDIVQTGGPGPNIIRL